MVVSIAALAVIAGSGSTMPTPVSAAATSLAPSAAARLLADADARLSSVEFADRNHAVATWQLCKPAGSGSCTDAVVVTKDGWRTRRVLPVVYRDDADSFPGFLARALEGGGVYLELTDGSAHYVAPDGSTSRLTLSKKPLAPGPSRRFLGPIGLLDVDAGVLDLNTKSVHPLAPAPHHAVRFSIVPDSSGRLWAVGEGLTVSMCEVLVARPGSATWTVPREVTCPPGAVVSIVALRHSAVVLTSPVVLTAARSATLLVVSDTGVVLARARSVVPRNLLGAHLVRAGRSVGLVTVPAKGASTIAPVDPATGAVGVARPLGALDLVNGAAGGVAWTRGSADDDSVTVYSTNLTSGTRVRVR